MSEIISPRPCRSTRRHTADGGSKYIAEDSLGPLRSPLRAKEEDGQGMNRPRRGQRNPGKNERSEFVRPLDRKPTLNQFLSSDVTEKLPAELTEDPVQSDQGGRRTRQGVQWQASHPEQNTSELGENRGGRGGRRNNFSRRSSDPDDRSANQRSVFQRLGTRTRQEGSGAPQQQQNARKRLWGGGAVIDTSQTAPFTAAKDQESEQESKELTEVQLARRQKDIDFGKSTIGYKNYVRQIPESERKKNHPRTPQKLQPCSRRNWDYQVRRWRRALHKFDPPGEHGSEEEAESGAMKSDVSAVKSEAVAVKSETHAVQSEACAVKSETCAVKTGACGVKTDAGAVKTEAEVKSEAVKSEVGASSEQAPSEEDTEEDETVQRFRSGKIKTWEEMMLEEEEKENEGDDDIVDDGSTADELVLDLESDEFF